MPGGNGAVRRSRKLKSEIPESAGPAAEIAVRAGEKIREIYNSHPDLETITKDDGSPLTRADVEANRIIVTALRERYPGHAILTEEEADDMSRLQNDLVWIIDPLDGTREFISRNGEFTVNLALCHRGQPLLGVIYLPAGGELYYAFRGGGSFRDKDGGRTEVHVSERSEFNEMIFTTSRSHSTELEKQLAETCRFAGVRKSGSSLKGCLVAEGEADVYLRAGPTREWDICAMSLIVEEAGGTMTDLGGRRLGFNKAETLVNGFLVSNGTAHAELLSLVRRLTVAPPS